MRVPTLKRATEWTCLRRPIAPCVLIATGAPGLVQINSVEYVISYHFDERGEVVGVRLAKADGTVYDIGPTGECDCPAGTYRHNCKHREAVAEMVCDGIVVRFTDEQLYERHSRDVVQ